MLDVINDFVLEVEEEASISKLFRMMLSFAERMKSLFHRRQSMESFKFAVCNRGSIAMASVGVDEESEEEINESRMEPGVKISTLDVVNLKIVGGGDDAEEESTEKSIDR